MLYFLFKLSLQTFFKYQTNKKTKQYVGFNHGITIFIEDSIFKHQTYDAPWVGEICRLKIEIIQLVQKIR